MLPINLFSITQIKDFPKFRLYYEFCSQSKSKQRLRDYEVISLQAFVRLLLEYKCNTNAFNGYYYNYEIDQIGKEFDLLRIMGSCVLNIELKSDTVPTEKIERQLRRNYYYLKSLHREIVQFCLDTSSSEVYTLDASQKVIKSTLIDMIDFINKMESTYQSDLDELFEATQFLVSPINTPEAFINNEYFLTTQQEEFKTCLMRKLADQVRPAFFAISGQAGTGKTLFLFDLAKELTANSKGCLIHCGILANGHNVIKRTFPNLNIVPAKAIKEDFDLSEYSYVFVDESHRIWETPFNLILQNAAISKCVCIFSYDARQFLSKQEYYRGISKRIEEITGIDSYVLTGKIRTNPFLSDFIFSLFNLNNKLRQCVKGYVSIEYAVTHEVAKYYIREYCKSGYKFINYTPSQYNSEDLIDKYDCSETSHSVLGQEFDNVIMILDNHFAYRSDGYLVATRHPNPDYLFAQLLFQGVTRVRKKLCLVIVDNMELFTKVLELVSSSNKIL